MTTTTHASKQARKIKKHQKNCNNGESDYLLKGKNRLAHTTTLCTIIMDHAERDTEHGISGIEEAPSVFFFLCLLVGCFLPPFLSVPHDEGPHGLHVR